MRLSFLADNPSEAKIIAKWYFEEWGYTIPSITEKIVLEKVSLKSKNRVDLPLIITVYENKELVGVAELKFREHKDYPQYEHWLGGVYVKQSERGKGYAKAIVSKAKEHTMGLGVCSLYLQCEAHNKQLYLNQGFLPVHSAIHNGVKTTIMIFKSGPAM
jgi:putative hydrolase of the HAD superfamily